MYPSTLEYSYRAESILWGTIPKSTRDKVISWQKFVICLWKWFPTWFVYGHSCIPCFKVALLGVEVLS